MARRSAQGDSLPPPLELECLKVLWTRGQGNVRDVREGLADRRKLAYTTVMTVLDRLARKGGVARRKVGRSFLYTPVYDREVLKRAAVDQLVASYFGGSREALLAYLAGGRQTRVENGAGDEQGLETVLL